MSNEPTETTEIKELYEDKFVLTNKGWHAGFDDEIDINLVAVAEIIDVSAYDPDGFPVKAGDKTYTNIKAAEKELGDDDGVEEFPIKVLFSLMAHPKHFHETYLKGILSSTGMDDIDTKDISFIADAHSYSGGIAFSLEGVTSSHTSTVDSIEVHNEKYGDRYFKNAEDAEQYLRQVYAYNVEAMMMLSGFVLDRYTNRIGTTGWMILEHQVKGTDWMEGHNGSITPA